jgi:hypothetical protein
MPNIDNALLFDIYHARENRTQVTNDHAIERGEEDVYPSLHNQLFAISHRVDRAIENIEIDGPRPRAGVPMHEGEI